MTEALEKIFKLCDEDPNHHHLTLRKSYKGFEKWFEAFRNGSNEFDIHLSAMRDLNIPEEEAIFILAYTGTHSSWINCDLREGENLSSPCKEAFAKSLNAVLNKMNSYNNQITYRMDIPPDDEQTVLKWFDDRKGVKFEIPYFLSSSMEDYNNSPVVWQIKTLDQNSYGKDISRLTNNKYEKEILFKRNSKFEIIGVEPDTKYVKLSEISFEKNVDFPLVGMYNRNF